MPTAAAGAQPGPRQKRMTERPGSLIMRGVYGNLLVDLFVVGEVGTVHQGGGIQLALGQGPRRAGEGSENDETTIPQR